MSRLFASVVVLLMFTAACSGSRTRGGRDGAVLPPVDAGPTGTDGGRSDGGPSEAFGYCPGWDPTTEDCREDSDCDPACGACTLGDICGATGCASECGSDADCTDGWCSMGCCAFCVPSCPGMPCAAGSTCDDTTGRCVPDGCDTGFECPINTRCEPGVSGADVRGCRRLDCASNADCDCGTCAQGRCWPRPGVCCPALPG